MGTVAPMPSSSKSLSDLAGRTKNLIEEVDSADLVVMGGYGHSRLREFVLGGATRGMLRSMTVPTLMAH